MASSNQAKTILTQGKKVVTSSRTRPVLENNVKNSDSDDSQEEAVQQKNAARSG